MLLLVYDDAKVYNFAGNNTLIYAGYNYDNIKQTLLHHANKVIHVSWFGESRLKVNPDKYVVFGKYNQVDNIISSGKGTM